LTNEVILLLFFIFFAIFGALGIFFLIRLTLRLEEVSKQLDKTLIVLREKIPEFTEQSRNTLKTIEMTSLKAQKLMNIVQAPIENIQSSGVAQAMTGFLQSFSYFKNLFTKSKNPEKGKSKKVKE